MIKMNVDSKLDKETTKQVIENSINNWLSSNNGFFPVAQDNDNPDEELIELDSLIIN